MSEQSGIEVKCVITERDVEGNERIVQIGGDGWQEKLSDVLLKISLSTTAYFTLVDGERADIEVVRPTKGPAYLRTNKDNEVNNNLLKLPRCVKALPTNM